MGVACWSGKGTNQDVCTVFISRTFIPDCGTNELERAFLLYTTKEEKHLKQELLR